MKFKNLHIGCFIIAVIGIITLTSYSTGKTGVSAIGCGVSGCHGNQSTTTSISMDFDGNSSLTAYTPGKKYTIDLSIDNSNLISTAAAKAGFDLQFSAGTISNNPSGTMIMSNKELHHTTPKAMTSGSATFTFDWTAPTAGSGTVTINIAANGVNGNDAVTGDAWNLKTITLTEFIAPKKANISTITSSGITTTTATINAQINANGNSTTAEVQYGLTTSYGSTKAMTPSSITGSSNTAATASLTGLTPNTTYNYRIKTTNTAGDSLSANSTFKTNSAGSAIMSSDQEVLSIFPNPSSDYVIIKSQNLSAIKEITLVDMSGKKIVLPTLRNGFDEIKLNTSTLSKGVYYIRFDTKSYPLVIQR